MDVCGNACVIRERIVHVRFQFCDRTRSIERLSSKVSLSCIHLLGFEYLSKASSKQRPKTGVKETTERIRVAGACSRNVRDLLMKVASSMKPEHADSR